MFCSMLLDVDAPLAKGFARECSFHPLTYSAASSPPDFSYSYITFVASDAEPDVSSSSKCAIHHQLL